MVKWSRIKDLLFIDNLWDVESIDKRIGRLNALLSYGSSYSDDARWTIEILKNRKMRLQGG